MKTLQKEDEDQWLSTTRGSRSSFREFSKGEKVFVKPVPAKWHQPWIYGKVIGSSAPRSCIINTSMGPVRRNHTQR